MSINVPSTSTVKDTSCAWFVQVEKIKVQYFLNSPRIKHTKVWSYTVFYMGLKLLTLTLKAEVTYKLLSRTSWPENAIQWEKLQTEKFHTFCSSPTFLVICYEDKGAACGAHGRDKKCMYACIYFLTHSLTPKSRVLENLPSSHLVKKYAAFYGTWRFTTMLTCAHHLPLSWARSNQAILPHPTFSNPT
jgi:hypothetical protein